MAERWVEKHAISQLQVALTVSIILAENLKISHFLAGAKFRRHAVIIIRLVILSANVLSMSSSL